MNQTEINELILTATHNLTVEQQITYTATFLELPLSVWLYIRELPADTHLVALQSAYIGFIAGKAEAREFLMKAFLSAAGFEHVVITAESDDVH